MSVATDKFVKLLEELDNRHGERESPLERNGG